MFIVDSHCHLDYPPLCDDLAGVLSRAEEAGVKMMVSISTRVREFDKLKNIVETYENVYCTVGTHPHNAHEELDLDIQELVRIAEHPKVVGIGEAGLDYHYDHSPREAQEQGFRMHIAAARETGLPLVIHSREAEDDTIRILEEEMKKGAFKPLLHCFSSKPYLAQKGVELGAYVSFSGIVTFKSATEIHQAAQEVQMDRILVETDAPYLAPVPHRGKKNEPAFTRHTLERVAELRNVSPEEMAKQSTQNFFRLFSKVVIPESIADEIAA